MLITDWHQSGAAGGCSGLDFMDVERGSSSCSHCGAQEGTSLVLAGPVMGKVQMSSSGVRIPFFLQWQLA